MSGPPPHHFLRRREGQRLGEVTQVLVCLATAPEPVTRSTGVVTGTTTIHVGLHCGLSRRPAIDTRRWRVGERRLVPRGTCWPDWFRFPPAATSIRACGSPAHGSPTPFTAGIRLFPLDPPVPEGAGGDDESVEADQSHAVR